MYSLNLKDNGVRIRAVDLHFNQGMKQKEVAALLDIRANTLCNFLSRQTWGDWWEEEGEALLRGDSYTGLSYYGKGPKMLSLDIETAPILGSVWGLWQQNVGLSMINADWYVLSWSAKWFGETEVLYEDKRESWRTDDDSELLKGIWKLLDEADIIITQNGKKFDVKKLNARLIQNGMSLRPWMNTHPNINIYYEDLAVRCSCGSQNLEHNGYAYTNLSKFDRFQCQDCGSEVRGRVNLLPKDKRQSLMMNVGS